MGFIAGPPCWPRQIGWGVKKRIRNAGSDGILAVRHVRKRDFVFLDFCRVARQSDLDGAIYEIAIADVVQHGSK